MLSGGVPEYALGSIYSAALWTFNKKVGGIRPVGVARVFCRLNSKLTTAIQPANRSACILKPKHLGVGV